MARIQLTSGDILRSDAEAIVNTVNCVGFMGRGIAARFKRSFPENFKAYAAACKRGEVVPGRMFIQETGTLTNPRLVVNFPTKRHWRANSRLEDIDAGLATLVEEVSARGIRSIAIPPLGCGLGGLDWSIVRPRIEHAFASLADVHVVIFEPMGAPDAKEMRSAKEAPGLTPGRAVLSATLTGRRTHQGTSDPARRDEAGRGRAGGERGNKPAPGADLAARGRVRNALRVGASRYRSLGVQAQ